MEKMTKSIDGNIIDKTFSHAEEALENAKVTGNNFWREAQSNTQKTWSQTKSFIQKHPGQAMGYAVLIGAIFGAIFYPKGRD